jgi:PIN domain nuclease of toxin-antitoxin system
MRLLLDTHILIWAVERPSQLSQLARELLEDPANDLMVSAGTVWEIAIKVGLTKLTLSLSYQQWMNQALSDLNATILPITVEYAAVQASLPNHHRDPFDRLLVAQAQVEAIPLVSSDAIFDQYGISRLW